MNKEYLGLLRGKFWEKKVSGLRHLETPPHPKKSLECRENNKQQYFCFQFTVPFWIVYNKKSTKPELEKGKPSQVMADNHYSLVLYNLLINDLELGVIE